VTPQVCVSIKVMGLVGLLSQNEIGTGCLPESLIKNLTSCFQRVSKPLGIHCSHEYEAAGRYWLGF
jgi:hypothetical protein